MITNESKARLTGIVLDQAKFTAALPANFVTPDEAQAVGEKFDEWVQEICLGLMEKCNTTPGSEEMEVNLNEALLVATAIYIFVLMNLAAAIAPEDEGSLSPAKIVADSKGQLFTAALDSRGEVS